MSNSLKKNNKFTIKKISVSSIFGALGFVLMLLEFPLPFIIPSFIKFDFSELPAVIAAFAYGPQYGVLVCFIKNALHCFITSTMFVGELSNFILGSIFVSVAGIIYSFMHNRKGALIGSISGALAMAIISIVTNMYIVYPFYVNLFFGGNMNLIIDMYQLILPSADSLFKVLIIFNLPFNFVKGLADAAICFIVYKKISPLLKQKI